MSSQSCAANTIGYTAGAITGFREPPRPSFPTTTPTPRAKGARDLTPWYVAHRSRVTRLPTGRIPNVDLTAIKRESRSKDRYKVEFGMQAINVLNHSQYFPGSLDTVNSIGSTGSRNFDAVNNVPVQPEATGLLQLTPRTFSSGERSLYIFI